MARPRKDGVDYFPHFVNWGKTIPILKQRFGNDGYAAWFQLLELLGKSVTHSIDLEDPMEWEYALASLGLTEQIATEFFTLIAKLRAIDPDLWEEDRVVWCQKFVDNLEDLYRKRSVSAPEKPALKKNAGVSAPETLVFSPVMPQSTAQHSTPKQSTEEESADAASPPEPKWTEEDMANAVMLRDQLLRLDPAYVQRAKRGSVDLTKWADEFRLIRERDMRQQADIEFILTHFPRDGFWSSNIRSPGSLRGLTKSSGKDKFLTILASVQQAVRQNGRSHDDSRNGNPKQIPDQFRRPILELEVARRAGALRKLGLDPECYDLEQLVPR